MTANTYPFAGKTVVVTGGGTGIGRAIARAFLDNGANVAVSGRRPAPLAEAIGGYPRERTLAVVNDIGRPGAAADLVSAVTTRFGGIDVVVSNAAGYAPSPDAEYITGAVLPVDGGTSASTGQPHIASA